MILVHAILDGNALLYPINLCVSGWFKCSSWWQIPTGYWMQFVEKGCGWLEYLPHTLTGIMLGVTKKYAIATRVSRCPLIESCTLCDFGSLAAFVRI